MKSTTIKDCKVLNLNQIRDSRGNLSFVEGQKDIPFSIKRVYYLYDVPGGASRGGHAHKNLHQLLIAIGGSFSITLKDGRNEITFNLNRAYEGLYLPPFIWRDIGNFSSGSSCLVLASEYYDESDYIRDWRKYLQYKELNKGNESK